MSVELIGKSKRMEIIAIANQKGGVGKTTTAVNLSASLAVAETQVLLVDLDPQGSATDGAEINISSNKMTLYESLVQGVSLNDCLSKTDLGHLSVIPSDERLYGAELELIGLMSRETRLQEH